MRISLNLASKPFINTGPILKRLRMGMIALAVLAVALGIGLYIYSDEAKAARARENAIDTKIANIEKERQGYETLMHRPENAELLASSSTLNALFDEKGFSWTLAMEDLETVLPAGVQVITLEPIRDKNGIITLHMRVNGPRDKSIDLVKNLERSKRFKLPQIVGENSVEAAGGSAGPNPNLQPVSASSTVSFDLLAVYVPATAEERRAVSKKPAADEAKTKKPVPQNPTTVRPPVQGVPPNGAARPPYTGPAVRNNNPGGRS